MKITNTKAFIEETTIASVVCQALFYVIYMYDSLNLSNDPMGWGGGGYHYPHFAEEETEARRCKIA